MHLSFGASHAFEKVSRNISRIKSNEYMYNKEYREISNTGDTGLATNVAVLKAISHTYKTTLELCSSQIAVTDMLVIRQYANQ